MKFVLSISRFRVKKRVYVGFQLQLKVAPFINGAVPTLLIYVFMMSNS